MYDRVGVVSFAYLIVAVLTASAAAAANSENSRERIIGLRNCGKTRCLQDHAKKGSEEHL